MNTLKVTVDPAECADRVTLQMADPNLVTFADGADTHQLSSSPEEVEIFGPNIFNYSEENVSGKATINYTVGEGGDPKLDEMRFYSILQLQDKHFADLSKMEQIILTWGRYSLKEALLGNWVAVLKPTQPDAAAAVKSFAEGSGLPAWFDPLCTSLIRYTFNAIALTDPASINGVDLSPLGSVPGIPRGKTGQFRFSKQWILRGLTIQEMAEVAEDLPNPKLGSLLKEVGWLGKWDSQEGVHAETGVRLKLQKGANKLEDSVVIVPWKLQYKGATLEGEFNIPNNDKDFTYRIQATYTFKFGP